MASSIFNSSIMVNQRRKGLKLLKDDIMKDMTISIGLNQSEMSCLLDNSLPARFNDQESITLDEQFQEILEIHGNSYSVFDAILNFTEILNKTIFLDNYHKDTTVFEGKNEYVTISSERNTWLLMHALYKDREKARNMGDLGSDSSGYLMSEREIIDNLYKNDSNIRECQIVVDWLERTAVEESMEYGKVGHFTDATVAWENTLHQIQNDSLAYPSSRQLVSSLDPDAPTRENKHLHDMDHDDQYRLLTEVLKEIRMGRLEKAEEMSLHCGHAWLAAALEGWRLYYDPNRINSQPALRGTVVEGEGNPGRDVWKWVAWSICQGDDGGHVDSHDALEKAIYGSLCGHLDSLRPLCTSWEDSLWAHIKTSIDVQVEKEIRDNTPRDYQQLPDKYWNSYFTLEEIFNKLKATSELKSEGNSIYRMMQELICLDRTAELIQTMASYIETIEDRGSTKHVIRFMAHVVLILRMMGRSYPEHDANNIIRAYVKVLAEEDNAELVAYYTSKLDRENQVEEFALFVEPIVEIKKKLEYLNVAASHQLDVTSITRMVSQLIWSKAERELNEEEGLSKETSPVDLMKINALDWMIFYPEQRSEALIQTNSLIRTFIAQGKIDAARKAYSKMSDDSIDMIMSQYNCRMDDKGVLETESLPKTLNSAITEYLAYKAYLDAQEGFSDWFKMYHSCSWKENVESLEETSDFTRQVNQRENARVMNEKYQLWKATIDHVTKTVKAQLYNVLVFPPRGWLVDIFASETDKLRKTQLDALRSLCIPEIIMLLHTVLHSMELYDDCLDLCTVIMSQEHLIYKVLSKEGLKDLVEKFSNSCLELCCGTPDAFALPPPVEPSTPLNLSL